jgi:hypothetical protein
MLVTRAEEWCVKAESAEEARELLSAGQGHRCHLGRRVHLEVERVEDDCALRSTLNPAGLTTNGLRAKAKCDQIATVAFGEWTMTEKFDPFDVAALEKAVNDSAVRVSTIWVTYLVFALYLVIAAGTVSHRQLFLEEPVKLPTLNIDLPLLGFFFLAPILFVIFHTYVLLQVLLLGRTAAAYNEAVDRAIKRPPGNALVRQRLANTLFAQIFAGSPREREGFIGWLLTLVAWVTLAIAPVLVLLVFQFKFLPYQSNFVT